MAKPDDIIKIGNVYNIVRDNDRGIFKGIELLTITNIMHIDREIVDRTIESILSNGKAYDMNYEMFHFFHRNKHLEYSKEKTRIRKIESLTE